MPLLILLDEAYGEIMSLINYNSTQRNLINTFLYGSTSSAMNISSCSVCSSTSSVSSITSCSVHTVSDSELLHKVIDKVVNDFPKGNLSYMQLESLLKSIGIEFEKTSKTRKILPHKVSYTYTFNVFGKKYTITCIDSDACRLGNDNLRIQTWSKSEIIAQTGISSEKLFNKYFEEVAFSESTTNSVSTVLQYKIKDKYKYQSLSSLKAALKEDFNDLQNALIIHNFMGDYKDKTDFEFDDAIHLKTFNKDNMNISITYQNYLDYINEISKNVAGYDYQEVINKVVDSFIHGNLTISVLKTVLNALGISSTVVDENNNTTVKFEFDKKTYTIHCNSSAAKKAYDTITVETFAPPKNRSLKELFYEYFEPTVQIQNNDEEVFSELNTDNLSQCSYRLKADKSLSEYEAKFAEISANLATDSDMEELFTYISRNEPITRVTTIDSRVIVSKIDDMLSSSNKFVKGFAKILDDTLNGYDFNYAEQQVFVNKVLSKIKAQAGCKNLKLETLLNFNQQCDGDFLKAIEDITNSVASNIEVYSRESVDNAKSLSVSTLISAIGTESKIYAVNLSLYSDLMLANDPGCRKLGNILYNLSKSDALYDNDINIYTALEWVIRFMNDEAGVKNTNPPELSLDTIQKLGNKFFDKLENIINNPVTYRATQIDSDGYVNHFRQGAIGDCWLLAGLDALRTSSVGEKMVKNSIVWNNDYTKAEVYFAGVGKTVEITYEEFIDFRENSNEHAKTLSDSDVILLELAFKKARGEIDGLGNWWEFDYSNAQEFFEWFVDPAYSKMSTGLNTLSLINGVVGLTGLTAGKVTLTKDQIQNYLESIYNNKQNGNYEAYAATFALFNTGEDAVYKFTTVDGKTEEFTMSFSGHVLSIVDITKDTVTFVNPHNSTIKYTVTWNEFKKIGIAQVNEQYFNDHRDNTFIANQTNYNMDDIMRSSTPTYIQLCSKVAGIDNAKTTTLSQIKQILNSIRYNIKGTDETKITRAYRTLVNYYTAAINAITVRNDNGTVGNSFNYYNEINGKDMTSTEKSNMRSAWDKDDVDTGAEIAAGSNISGTGLYIGHDKDALSKHNYNIFINAKTIISKFMALIA